MPFGGGECNCKLRKDEHEHHNRLFNSPLQIVENKETLRKGIEMVEREIEQIDRGKEVAFSGQDEDVEDGSKTQAEVNV